MDILDPITGEVLYSTPDWDTGVVPVANDSPMNGGQSNPVYSGSTDDYGAPIYSEISSANYTYDAGGSAISIPAFKAAQAVTDAALKGTPIDKSLLQKMTDAGMDTNTIKTVGGALWRLVAQPNGTYAAQATNAQATAAMQATKTKNMMLYAGIAILAYLGLS